MQDFTIQELYEISDALYERRARLLAREFKTSLTEKMISLCKATQDKVMSEIINRTSTL